MKISFLFLLVLLSTVGSFVSGQAKILLPMAKPEAVGLDPKKLEAVDEKMEALIEENRLTGGTVVIARKGKVAHFETYGLRNREEELPVERIRSLGSIR
jgi:CubicO group peptidase (beta-lactamase class C family)